MPLKLPSAYLSSLDGQLTVNQQHPDLRETMKAVDGSKSNPLRMASLRRFAMSSSPIEEVKDFPLLQLAKLRRFDLISDYLVDKSDEEVFAWIDDCSLSSDGASGMQTFKGETILHLIMLYQPPVDVVCVLIQRMIQKRPGTVPEAATDMLSRTPLHIAVAHNCDVAVIERLLSGTVTLVPAVAKDAQQRLPLHWACAKPKSSSKEHPRVWFQSCAARLKDAENTIKIIEALVEAYPHAVLVQDQAGMTPLDLAITNFAHPYVLRMLDNLTASKSPSAVEHSNSNSGTEDTLQSDVPFEISNSHDDFDLDGENDDVSSIGTGGISNYHWNGKKKRSQASTLEYIQEQFQI